MDKGFHTRMILVDLQKVFDMLDHTVILQKMECIGFKESVIKWFQSYLSNRNFFVTRKHIFQGCILGPLLFLICINDWPQALNEAESYLYADDICIFYQNKDVETIEKVLNRIFVTPRMFYRQ